MKRHVLLCALACGVLLIAGTAVTLMLAATRERTVTLDLRIMSRIQSVPYDRHTSVRVVLPDGREFTTRCLHIDMDRSSTGTCFYIYGPMGSAASAAKQLSAITAQVPGYFKGPARNIDELIDQLANAPADTRLGPSFIVGRSSDSQKTIEIGAGRGLDSWEVIITGCW